ncbi:MAG: helix-turn-helix domain-containing protein [Armatimonadetes bacterium]|nr:helix-turn-helix domain-containing protein [Armatimonadota bacterium]
MEPIGETLRRAREARGLALQQAKDALHMHAGYLEALETEEFGRLPAPVYARAFLRQYARFLGLDPEPLVQAYNVRQPEPEGGALGMGWTAAPEPQSRWGRALAMVAVVAALGVFALGGYGALLFQSGKEQTKHSAALSRPGSQTARPAGVAAPEVGISPLAADPAAGAGDVLAASPGPEERAIVPTPAPANTPATAPASAPAAAPSPAPTQAPEVRLTLVARANCWVRIKGDGKLLYEGTLQPGETRTWKGSQTLEVRAGNPGAIRATVNGKDLGMPGKPGEVWHRIFKAEELAPPVQPSH